MILNPEHRMKLKAFIGGFIAGATTALFFMFSVKVITEKAGFVYPERVKLISWLILTAVLTFLNYKQLRWVFRTK